MHRIDYLNNETQRIDAEKLGQDQLESGILEYKRLLKNLEVKTRKFLGISEEKWEGFDNLTNDDNP
jgi:hypothetical protein